MATQAVRKIRQLYDEGPQVWRDIYKAPGIEGTPIRAEVPREDQEPNAVRRLLLRKGAAAAAVEDRDTLLTAIAADAPVVRRAAHVGWRNGNQLFVSHHHVAGEIENHRVVPPVYGAGAVGQLMRRGDLDGWRALVGVAAHSTSMTVALCAPFAAPLLALVGRPSFALVFVGPSRCGKSTAQLLGASALGFGTEKDLPSLNATHAGLISAALAFNDHMLPINEVGTARGAKRDIYVALREATYSLMNGQDVLRHPSWVGDSSAPTGTFQVICLMSSEHSPDAWASRHGETRDEGEMARLIALPVLAAGRRTVFDRAPKGLTGKERVAWAGEQFRALRRGLPQQCGTALPDFLDILVRDQRDLGSRARRLVASFESRLAKPGMSPVARDIVAKFGVLFAGGILAVRTGILPLEKKVVGSALRRACEAALACLPDPHAELRADLHLLKGRLESGGMLDLDACTGRQRRLMRNVDGFHQPKNSGRLFVVRAQVFAGWFGTPLRTRRVLEWLANEGFLDHGRDLKQGRSNEWAQKQVGWPDGTRQRSISLYLPAGLTDLERDG